MRTLLNIHSLILGGKIPSLHNKLIHSFIKEIAKANPNEYSFLVYDSGKTENPHSEYGPYKTTKYLYEFPKEFNENTVILLMGNLIDYEQELIGLLKNKPESSYLLVNSSIYNVGKNIIDLFEGKGYWAPESKSDSIVKNFAKNDEELSFLTTEHNSLDSYDKQNQIFIIVNDTFHEIDLANYIKYVNSDNFRPRYSWLDYDKFLIGGYTGNRHIWVNQTIIDDFVTDRMGFYDLFVMDESQTESHPLIQKMKSKTKHSVSLLELPEQLSPNSIYFFYGLFDNIQSELMSLVENKPKSTIVIIDGLSTNWDKSFIDLFSVRFFHNVMGRHSLAAKFADKVQDDSFFNKTLTDDFYTGVIDENYFKWSYFDFDLNYISHKIHI